MKLNEFIQKYNLSYISSRANPRIVDAGKLNEKKYRDREEIFLADGSKLAAEAVKYAEPRALYVSETSAADFEEIIADYVDAGVPVFVVADGAFEKISTEKSPEGIIAALAYMTGLQIRESIDSGSISNFDDWQNGKRLIMLDGIRDPGNLGTILRTAEAMGMDGVILSDCADIYNRKTVRAAMGTIFRIPLYITSSPVNIIEKMKGEGRRVIAAALGDNTLELGKYEISASDCPIIGNEGHGLSETIIGACGECVKIPMHGKTESLNAASAATAIMWEYCRSI